MKCCVIKKDVTFSSFTPLYLTAILTLALAVLAMIMGFIYIPILVFIIGIIIMIYFSPRCINQEYEYSLEGDKFIVAVIMNKSSRKELFSADMDKLISCEPEKAASVTRDGVSSKIKACSGNNPRYSAAFNGENGMSLVTFSPAEEFLESMRIIAPSKVKVR